MATTAMAPRDPAPAEARGSGARPSRTSTWSRPSWSWAIITFYPLVFQVWMSFTDFGPKNFRVNNPVAPNVRRAGQLLPDRDVAAPDPELRVPAAGLLQPVVGVQQRRHPRHPRRAGRGPAEHQGPACSGASTARCSSSRSSSRRSSSRRSGGTCSTPDAGAVNFLHPGHRRPRSGSRPTRRRSTSNWLRQSNDPIPFIPLPLAYFAMLIANTWLGWPLNAVVATGALQSIPGDLYEAAEMDGANALAEVPAHHDHLPPAGDAAVRDLRLRDHVQPVLPAVLHDRRRAVRADGDPRDPGVPPGRRPAACSASPRPSAVYLFFLLLAVTLVTNRLAKATKSYAE